MELRCLLDDLLLERSLARSTAGQYSLAVREFSVYIGREATDADLSHHRVNQWLRDMEDRVSPYVVKSRWRGLSAVWNYAAEVSRVDPPHPRRVRRCKLPPPQPTVWQDSELPQLLGGARALVGRRMRCGLDAGHTMEAAVRVIYSTAMRRSDLLCLRFDQVAVDGALRLVQGKTNHEEPAWLDVHAMTAVAKIRQPARDRIFPFGRTCLRRWWKRMLDKAELPKGRREGPQKMRRTAATGVALEHGMEAASQFLGHKTPGLAAKHYVPQHMLRKRITPPPLQAPSARRRKRDAG